MDCQTLGSTSPPTSECVYGATWVRSYPENFLPYISNQAKVLGFKFEAQLLLLCKEKRTKGLCFPSELHPKMESSL